MPFTFYFYLHLIFCCVWTSNDDKVYKDQCYSLCFSTAEHVTNSIQRNHIIAFFLKMLSQCYIYRSIRASISLFFIKKKQIQRKSRIQTFFVENWTKSEVVYRLLTDINISLRLKRTIKACRKRSFLSIECEIGLFFTLFIYYLWLLST